MHRRLLWIPFTVLLGSPGYRVWHAFIEGQQNERGLWDSRLSATRYTVIQLVETGPAETRLTVLHWVWWDMVCTSGIEQWGFGPRDPLRFPHMRLRLRSLRWWGVTFILCLVSEPIDPSSSGDSNKGQNVILVCSDVCHVIVLRCWASGSLL